MRVTQGAFSFLPDLTDDQIADQVRYALGHGWSISTEHTDDPHPRNSYWELWGHPLFDLEPGQADVVMREIIRQSVANIYDSYFAGVDTQQIEQWFNLGGTVELNAALQVWKDVTFDFASTDTPDVVVTPTFA